MDDQYQQKIDSGEPDNRKSRPTKDSISSVSNVPQTADLNGVQTRFSPWRFLIITIGGIFLAEVVAMILIYGFPNLPYYLQTLIDASIMVLLIFPLVYSFSLKPLLLHIEKHRRAEDALQQSEERFAKAFNSSPVALSITTYVDGCFIDVNESFLRLYGSSREELIGHSSIELGMYVNPDKRVELTRQILTQPNVDAYEVEACIKSGETRSVLISTEMIELNGEACILASISDITERKRAEERLRRVNHALSVLNECNQVLVRAENENELLQRMCENIVNVGEYRMAWVGFAEQDQARSVRPAAQFGFEDGYLGLAQITWADNERGRGPTGTAIREGVTQVNQNFLTNPRVAPWRESALKRGYQASIALPLKDERSTFGALTIYSASPDAFDEEEVNLLNELANDLAFGITALVVRAERNRAQEQVREMALFPALNPDAVLRVDASGRIEKTNPAASQMGLCVGAQLVEILPDMCDLDFDACIAMGTTQQISETQLGERYLQWTIRGVSELGLAFLYSIDVTERKRAEVAVRQLSRIVEQTEDAVVVTDRKGVIEYVNPAFERLTGFTKEEALGKTPNVLNSGLHDEHFYKRLWNTILNGGVFLSEIANRKKNGELFHEVKTITPLRDAQGKITHFVATGKDITKHKLDEEKLRKAYDELELRVQDRTEELQIANSELEDEIRIRQQVEDALRQSEQQLSKAQEIAHLGSWELDLEHNRLTWSDEVYRIFGLQPQEFGATYEAFLEAVHADDRAVVDAAYSDSVREGRDNYEIEHRVVKRSSGEVRIVHEKCKHFRNEVGQINRSIGMVHDVTERKMAEEALRKARDEMELRVQERTGELAVKNRELVKEIAERKEVERQLRIQTTAMEAAANGIIITDRQGTIQWTNPALTQITGYEARELLGQNTHIFNSGKHDADYYRQMWTAILSGQVWRGETTNRRKDSSLYVEEQTITPVRDEKDQILHFIAIKQDVTQQKRVEEELELERSRLRRILDTMPDGVFMINRQYEVEYVNPVIEKEFGPVAEQSCYTYFHDRIEPCPWCKNEEVLSGKTLVWEHHYLKTNKTYDVFETPFINSNGSISKFKMLHDITQRKMTEEELGRRNVELQAISVAEHEQRQLSEALVEAALVLNKSMKLDDVLPLILEQIKEVIPYQLANITMLDAESFYDASHEGDQRWQKALAEMIKNRFPLEDFPLLKKMRQSGQPLLILDIQKESDWVTVNGLEWCRSFLSAPLLAENEVIGFVNLFAGKPGFFTVEMQDRLVAFASHAAVAIQNAWLFEQVRASSDRLQSLSHRLVEIQENERLYIARELHDEAGQMLTSLMLNLRMLETQAYQPEVILKKVAEMEEALNAVSENLHSVAMALRPASLDHLGLVPALRQHVESVGEKYGLRASFRSGKFQERLPANMETELYRIVQEALTNVVRHSHASQVDVILTVRDNKLIVIVEDDGDGFNPEKVSDTGHLGLFGIRERAEMIGGKLVIESAPGNGTTLIVEVSYADSNINRG